MNLLNPLLKLTGLSQTEASDYLDVRLSTVKSWSAGRVDPPSGVIRQMTDLAQNQIDAAEEAAKAIDAAVEELGLPVTVPFGVASDDEEARSLGWPSVSAHKQVAAHLAAILGEGIQINLVPRGGTVESAAAADLHDRSTEK